MGDGMYMTKKSDMKPEFTNTVEYVVREECSDMMQKSDREPEPTNTAESAVRE